MAEKIEDSGGAMLKPCPFCGGAAHSYTIEPHKHFLSSMPDYGGGAFVECTCCTCCISAETEETAVRDWNRRG